MNFVLAYYLTSVAMSLYMSKAKGLKFSVEIGEMRMKEGLSTLLASPLLLPFMCLVAYNNRSGK